MSQPGIRVTEHQIKVLAPALVIYQLIADVANWSRIFPPTVHIEYLERGEQDERIQLWATANGSPKTWISRRVLDPTAMRVEFRQEQSQNPVESMGGAWVIEPISENESLVRLLHDYRAVDDDPEKLAWIGTAVETNSQSELEALKTNAELATESPELLLTFGDTVQINGSVKDVYDFINEADLWSERLPHVAEVSMVEDSPGIQVLAMDTTTEDGDVHTTKSIRVTFPPNRIVYKQTEVPPLMTLHTGEWSIEENSTGVAVTSTHTVMINESNIAKFLGADAGVEDARKFLRTTLGTNSTITMKHAKEYAEGRTPSF
jgi:aromatase